MFTYTSFRTQFGQITGNSETANLNLGSLWGNEAQRNLIGAFDWLFLYKSLALSTVAGQQGYDLPNDYGKLVMVYVTVGSTNYRPQLVASTEAWIDLNYSSTFESDYPEYYRVINNTIEFWPVPSTSSLPINITYKRRVVDFSEADYTTGTISAVANGGTTITGSGTTWNANMEGRMIQIDYPTGDGQWYTIEDVASTTSITISRPYQGTTIAAGSSTYIIGDTPVIPEDFQMGMMDYATAQYRLKEGRRDLYQEYMANFEATKRRMKRELATQTINHGLDAMPGIHGVNPNNYPRSIG